MPTDLTGWPLVLAAAVLVFDVVVRVVALVVIPYGRRPAAALAWLLAVFFVPVIGSIVFLLIGSPHLPRARRATQARMSSTLSEVSEQASGLTARDPQPAWVGPVADLNYRLGAMPLLHGNSAELISDYEAILTALTDAVRGARRTVHVEFYILSLDVTTAPFFDALADAVSRGVRVLVLLDHMGSLRSPGYRATVQALRDAGVQWHLMLPVQPLRGRYQRPDLRNHRKLVVVDAETAFLGSINLIDASYNKRANLRRGLQWRDVMVRLHGPVVLSVEAVFATDWLSETGQLPEPPDPEVLRALMGPSTASAESSAVEGTGGPLSGGVSSGRLLCQVVPSGPGFLEQNNLKLFNELIYAARRRLCITSPYFVPDESLLQALTSAALRGVDVELVVCEVGDQALVHHAQSSYYGVLLEAGVSIWLYPAPFVLHAKHISVDDDVAVVGSSNMDIRSFLLDLEVSLLVVGREFTDELRAEEARNRALSRQLTLAEWRGRPRLTKLLDNLARLTSALQ